MTLVQLIKHLGCYRYEPAGGAIIVTCSDATWLRRCAHVESGCSGPPKDRSTCCQVQVLGRSSQDGEGAGLGYGAKLSGCTGVGLPRERALLSRTRLQATVASGLRRSGPPKWTSSDRGERSPPERATGVDFERPWRAVSAGAGNRSGLELSPTINEIRQRSSWQGIGNHALY